MQDKLNRVGHQKVSDAGKQTNSMHVAALKHSKKHEQIKNEPVDIVPLDKRKA